MSDLVPDPVTQAVDALLHGSQPGVVLDSPPGAGKSRAVIHTALHLAAAGEPVRVVAQTNSQVDDLVDKIARRAPDLQVGRYTSLKYEPHDSLRRPNVIIGRKIGDLSQVPVVVGTAAKWLDPAITDQTRWGVIDEAYQMRSDTLLGLAPMFDRAMFVGDPGQLDPFSVVNVERWTGLPWNPLQSAVAAMIANNPAIPVFQLRHSWRLPPSASAPVSAAFYPFAPFTSAPGQGTRRMWFATNGFGTTLDRALDTAAGTGWAYYELPARHTLRTDAEAVGAVAAMAVRVLQRGAMVESLDQPAGAHVRPDRVAVGAVHRDQVAAIRKELDRVGGSKIRVVDTANRLQGAEFDVVVVLHPLSGRRDASAFHLESGRLCVLTSRHRHACIVVGRAGIAEMLDAHPTVDPVPLYTEPRFPNGWEANQSMLEHLSHHLVRAS
ncbi:AAA domain-containing protein [Micromonospora sp. WMMD710]|uniref:AAA domain-containing protein n=1 Tax=Micromonospora sp. WMMD710 TaxID=3016085 RepID=UPI0024170C57|nr:AAA domain-containing protein [Micromonospora sp. WMMD710]MDG4760321.1 AAA family ATPase [Micromonospora sp. WMMD710]